jgi:hypothetical protein
MVEWQVISRNKHKNSLWTLRRDFKFASDQTAVPVLIAELQKIITQFAIGFIKNDNGFETVAILGFHANKSAYVNDKGEWLAAYIPALFRVFPYNLPTNNEGIPVLCIDSGHLDQPDSTENLFEIDGGLAAKTAEVLNLLEHCNTGLKQTREATRRLAELNLLVPWEIELASADEKPATNLLGVYRIDENLLNDLDDTTFAGLRESGAIAIAYAQLFSLPQISQITLRTQYHEQRRNQQGYQKEIGAFLNDDIALNFDDLK